MTEHMSGLLAFPFCLKLHNGSAGANPMNRKIVDYPMFSEDDSTTYQRMQWIDEEERDAVLCAVAFSVSDQPSFVGCSITSTTFNLTERARDLVSLESQLKSNDNISTEFC